MNQLLLGIILGQIAILLVLRPLVLWYFKLNRIATTLESIDLSLKQLPAVQAYRGMISQPGKKVA